MGRAMEVHTEISDFVRAQIVERGVARFATAGAACLDGVAWNISAGVDPSGDIQRPFDLASVSKPFLALLAARLVQAKQFSWQTPLERLLPVTSHTPGGAASIEQHLSHRAGLRAHIEFFQASWAGRPMNLSDVCRSAANASRAGNSCDALYSDLGYFLVGRAIEHSLGSALDSLIHELVAGPWQIRIGSSRAWRKSEPTFSNRVAPTELQPPRGGPLQGVVHDDNSWALSGTKTSGHAGLFGTLQAVLQLGCKLLEEQEEDWLIPLLQPRPGGTLRMGFDGVSGPRSMAGSRAGALTFGHLGFTGTSFWCDPEAQRVTALLTNRVYPTRENPKIRAVRPKMHDFLWHY